MFIIFVLIIISYSLFYSGMSNLVTGGTGYSFWQALGLPQVITTAKEQPAPFNPQPRATTTAFIQAAKNYQGTGANAIPGPGNPPGKVPKGGPGKATPIQARAFAKRAMPAFGWGPSQWAPLNMLWTRESGWRWDATNPNSGAYGIPQSLPGSKMASQGKSWRTNAAVQIIWGLKYIKSKYGNPATAWAHELAFGWY